MSVTKTKKIEKFKSDKLKKKPDLNKIKSQ